jgi:hypothetical protein
MALSMLIIGTAWVTAAKVALAAAATHVPGGAVGGGQLRMGCLEPAQLAHRLVEIASATVGSPA